MAGEASPELLGGCLEAARLHRCGVGDGRVMPPPPAPTRACSVHWQCSAPPRMRRSLPAEASEREIGRERDRRRRAQRCRKHFAALRIQPLKRKGAEPCIGAGELRPEGQDVRHHRYLKLQRRPPISGFGFTPSGITKRVVFAALRCSRTGSTLRCGARESPPLRASRGAFAKTQNLAGGRAVNILKGLVMGWPTLSGCAALL